MTALDDLLLEPSALAQFGPVAGVADQAHALLLQQRSRFALARAGYASLERIQTRQFDFDGYAVQLQCNPGRLRSSAARVDAGSISTRPCFLCPGNLPPGQRALRYGADLLILANPYPVAPEHLTIPAVTHTPQRLARYLRALLGLAADLAPRYTVLYNGPRCGASAPDHLHFQAVPADFLPLDRDFAALAARHGTRLRPVGGAADGHGTERVQVTLLGTLACPCVALEGDDASSLADAATGLLALLADLARPADLAAGDSHATSGSPPANDGHSIPDSLPADDGHSIPDNFPADDGRCVPGSPPAAGGACEDDGEPMVNLLARYHSGWRLVVIPRVRHRPSTYPADGHGGILLSPASVDLAGVCITPRQEDFDRLEAATLRQIFAEVCLGHEAVCELARRVRRAR